MPIKWNNRLRMACRDLDAEGWADFPPGKDSDGCSPFPMAPTSDRSASAGGGCGGLAISRGALSADLALWAMISGVSLFVLTGLVHEASHRLLTPSVWLNELAGNLAGWMVLTPLTAYRAFHLKHHQSTNREGDPNAPLNSRWMLGVGAITYTALIHRHAWRNLRGRLLGRHLVEMAGMTVFLAALALLLPRAVRERAWLLPTAVVGSCRTSESSPSTSTSHRAGIATPGSSSCRAG